MKTAMIWGASGGIGRALVSELLQDDWTVLAVTHRPTQLAGLTPHLFDANVADPYEVQLAVNAASQIVTEIDLWVYTAGDIGAAKTAEMPPNTWRRLIEANLTGAFLTTHYSLPLLAETAHMFYLGAISERLALPRLGAYAAAKAGLEAFVDALGKEERRRRVTLVRPGAVDTPFWERVPLKPPANALTPQTVAQKILDAYQQQHQGRLDL